jgi:O-antigen/teichoic acid export membrane protein
MAAVGPRSESGTARHLLRSTASNVAGQVVVLGVWFGLTPFMVHRLGATDYGLWVLVASLIAYGNLLDLGVGAAVTKYVAEFRARGRSEEASALIATALSIYSVVGLLIVLASAPFALVFPHLFNIAPGQESEARSVVFLTGLALAVKLPTTTAYAVLRGLQRFDLNNLISVSATLVQAAATITVLLLGGGVVGLAALIIPLTLLTQIPMLGVIRHIAPDLRFGLRGAQRRLVRTVASFSTSLVVINAGGIVKTETDQVVIGAALPLSTLAPYSLAQRISLLPTMLTYQFVRVLFPLASELHGITDRARLRALYVGSTRLALALFVPVGAGLMVLAQPFLTAWVGESFAGDANIAVILIAAGFFDMPMLPAASMLMGTDAHRPLALFVGGSALLNLGLSVALVGSMGVTGVALATLIATGLQAFVVTPFAMRRYDVPLTTLASEALMPGLLPAVPAVLTLFALRAVLDPSSLVAVLAVGAIGGLVYAAGYLSFSASASERLALRRVALGTLELARARR